MIPNTEIYLSINKKYIKLLKYSLPKYVANSDQ